MSVPVIYLSVEECLKLDEKSEIRHEYLGGQIFAMSGGSKEHNIIAGNIYSRLRSYLRGGSCSVFMFDMKVRIELANQSKSLFYYPDVIVTCDPQEGDRFFLNYPCLIIEVLSPSTEITDRREKLINDQTLASLQEYVLVSQNEIKVEIYRKDKPINWSVETLQNSDNLFFDSVSLTLTMAEIYEDVFAV